MRVRTRIAPSPTGDPHIGTIYQALFDYAYAKQNKGNFILRVEDTDRERFVEGATQKILSSLKWFSIEPDESPVHGGDFGPYVQSERLDIYKKYINDLILKKEAYLCFCTKERLDHIREEQIKNKQQPKYDKHCLNLTKKEIDDLINKGTPSVVRLNVKPGIDIIFNDLIRGEIKIKTDSFDDQVLLKSDGYPTYHAAVVIDDHLMKITHIIRGEEWISSTPKHILLYKAFEWDIPMFAHLSLLRNRDKSKISKRHNNTSIDWYKKEGYLPEALTNYLLLLGWSHPEGKEVYSLDEFIKKFSFDRVSKGGPIFDIDKLNWINGVYIRSKSVIEIKKLIKPYLIYDIENKKLEEIIKLIQDRLKKLSEINDLISFFVETPQIDQEILENIISKDKIDEICDISYKTIEDKGINRDTEETLRNYAIEKGYNIGDFFMIIRIVTTGKKATPPLFDTLSIIGKKETLKRLKNGR